MIKGREYILYLTWNVPVWPPVNHSSLDELILQAYQFLSHAYQGDPKQTISTAKDYAIHHLAGEINSIQ